MTTQEINNKVKDVLSFVKDNRQFKKKLDAFVIAYESEGYIEFLSWYCQIDNGKLLDDLLKRWKNLLAE